MGRYYGGDIAGKFWFGVQSSTDARHFGVEPLEQELVYSRCLEPCSFDVQEEDACPYCDQQEECCAAWKNEIEFHFSASHIEKVKGVLTELEEDLLKETPRFSEVVRKLEEDTEWMQEEYKDDSWIDYSIDELMMHVGDRMNDPGNFNLLAARYLLGTQILRCLIKNGSCGFWCEL